MREASIELAAKDAVYVDIASKLIAKHKIPPRLTFDSEETNAMFVSTIARTRASTGAKKVRMLGIGHSNEKSQITVTITAVKESLKNPEESHILVPKLIFKGTTRRCHPPALVVVLSKIN
jgi:hypothetical protein